MGELRIPIGMVRAFARLAVRLTAVFHLAQQVRHHALAGLEPPRCQCLDQVAQAPADPTQRRTGIATDGVLDQRLQRCRQARLMRHRALASAARTAHPLADVVVPGSKLRDAAIDRAAGQTRCRRRRRHPAIALRHRLVRRKQPPSPFVEKSLRLLPARADIINIDHPGRLTSCAAWHEIVGRCLDDYRSGRSLMDHLGADRLIDPALTGMLLAIRRGLVEEVNAVSMSDYVLIDMAVIAFANEMRIQSMIGNTALILESEMFGQPTLRARWRKEYGYRPEDIRGLAVDDHVARLRDDLLPLAERFHRMAEAGIEALRRQRREPSVEVERSATVAVCVVRATQPFDKMP